MWLSLAATTAALLAQQTDTTFPVRPTARLEINNYGGEIVVRTWTRNVVRVQAEHSSRDRIEITTSEAAISVKASSSRGPSQMTDYVITVPATMPLRLSGVYLDISVEGTQGDLSAETVEGDIRVRGGGGFVSLQSVEGEVAVDGARGRIKVNSVDGDVSVSSSSGEITAETVDGNILLEKVESSLVEANTVDGDIHYDGTLKSGGRYRLSTHDGDIAVAIPEGAGVSGSVATFSGDFDSTFPITVKEQTRRRFKFVLGAGGAILELESFDGSIRLHRPGESPDGEHDKHDKHKEEPE